MESSKTKGALLLLAVFVLGLICGGSGMIIGLRLMRPGPMPMPAPGTPPQARFVEILDLDADQEEQVRTILDRSRTQVFDVMQESRGEIREILREDQLEKFDRLGSRIFDGSRRGRGRRFGRRP